jgi:ubiquinone/menaquinone biosynthesis C-methylase UbiE
MASHSFHQRDNPQPQYTHSGNIAEQVYLEKRSAEVEAAFLLHNLRRGFDLLDCGCGPETITIGLAEAVSPGRVTGIDMEKTQIEKARELAAQRGLTNIQFEVCNLDEMPFPDASFNVVFANAVFEHLSDPLRVLGEIHRVLKSGGIIALRDADLDLLTVGGTNAEL